MERSPPRARFLRKHAQQQIEILIPSDLLQKRQAAEWILLFQDKILIHGQSCPPAKTHTTREHDTSRWRPLLSQIEKQQLNRLKKPAVDLLMLFYQRTESRPWRRQLSVEVAATPERFDYTHTEQVSCDKCRCVEALPDASINHIVTELSCWSHAT
ncbi:hypothetical protein F2P81_013040 [Scophthalmus maximus]|uniref:Uncharacterized protein n=1 Tax=Scophthalmus maximus TaxID=52904 RepID=A0A6A4SZ46_SCOMX|nr:hypothetical protein F2P81_013040 [Scophthalmus maximus]